MPSKDARNLITARMSPGRWWGFNGVHTLELHNGLLIHSFHTAVYGYVARVFGAGEIVVRKHVIVRRRGREWSRLELSARGRHMRFTGHPADSEPFIEALVGLCEVADRRS